MADRVGQAALLYSFSQLGGSISQYVDRRREQSRKKRMAILGAEFSKRIGEVTDVEQLTGLMLKANEISSMLEIPELAQQINNLGNLKQLQLSTAKKEELAKKTGEFTGRMLGEQIISQGGEFIKFSESERYKEIEQLPVDMQAEAFSLAYNQSKATVESQLTRGDSGYEVNYYRRGKSGESELFKQLKEGKGGTYDDITTEAIEHFDKPLEIAQQELKDFELEEASRRIDERYRKHGGSQYGSTFRTMVLNDAEGNPFVLNFAQNKSTGELTITDLSGKELTQQDLSGLSKYKQDIPDNPYESIDAYDKAFKKLEFKNINNASALQRTILSTSKKPNEEYEDLYYKDADGLEQLSDPTVSMKTFWATGDLDRLINKLEESDEGKDKILADQLIVAKTNWFNSNKDFDDLQNRTYKVKKKKKKDNNVIEVPDGDNTDQQIPDGITLNPDSSFSIYD